MPAGPRLQQFIGVAALGHDLAQLLEVLAGVGTRGAKLALAVRTFHFGDDARQLLAFLRVGGSGDGERKLQQLELARGNRVELEPVEACGLFGVIDSRGYRALIQLGRQDFGIVGDISGFDPVGAGGIDAEDQELLLDIIDELAGLFGGCLRIGRGGKGCEAQGGTPRNGTSCLPN